MSSGSATGPRLPGDEDVLATAAAHGQVLITLDKDFDARPRHPLNQDKYLSVLTSGRDFQHDILTSNPRDFDSPFAQRDSVSVRHSSLPPLSKRRQATEGVYTCPANAVKLASESPKIHYDFCYPLPDTRQIALSPSVMVY